MAEARTPQGPLDCPRCLRLMTAVTTIAFGANPSTLTRRNEVETSLQFSVAQVVYHDRRAKLHWCVACRILRVLSLGAERAFYSDLSNVPVIVGWAGFPLLRHEQLDHDGVFHRKER